MRVRDLAALVNHSETYLRCRAERAFMKTLNGGCSVSLGALATILDGQLTLQGFVSGRRGRHFLNDSLTGSAADPERIGIELADSFLRAGAGKILEGE